MKGADKQALVELRGGGGVGESQNLNVYLPRILSFVFLLC